MKETQESSSAAPAAPKTQTAPNSGEDYRATLGEKLRRARSAKGVTLTQAAAATRINADTLQALEENNPRQLPAPVFTRGFVRIYAAYLGLDTDAALRLHIEEQGLPTSATTEKINIRDILAAESMAEAPRGLTGNHVFTILFLLVLGFLAYWGYISYFRDQAPPSVFPPISALSQDQPGNSAVPKPEPPFLNDQLAQPAAKEEAEPGSEIAGPAAEPAPAPKFTEQKLAANSAAPPPPAPTAASTPASAPTRITASTPAPAPATARIPASTPPAQPVPTQPADSPAPAVAEPTPTAQAAPLPPARVAQPEPTPPPAAGTAEPPASPLPHVVAAHFTEDTWLRLRVDNDQPRQLFFQAGETRTWEAHEELELRVGNAGGVRLSYNGSPLPPLGPSGRVINLRFP